METMILAIAKMVLVLGIVCAVLLFLTRVWKRSGVGKPSLPSDSGVRLLTTQWIAPQKYISLVEIGGEVLALGISETQITFLTRIENKEFLEKVSSLPARPKPLSLFHSFSWLPLKYKGPTLGLLRRFYVQ